ncbi:MAG: hypothetical protein GEV11_07780, partial [Streptosporangiales bacterium]|nr:hypothetical protein [Streptosporangiales bacterium]
MTSPQPHSASPLRHWIHRALEAGRAFGLRRAPGAGEPGSPPRPLRSGRRALRTAGVVGVGLATTVALTSPAEAAVAYAAAGSGAPTTPGVPEAMGPRAALVARVIAAVSRVRTERSALVRELTELRRFATAARQAGIKTDTAGIERTAATLERGANRLDAEEKRLAAQLRALRGLTVRTPSASAEYDAAKRAAEKKAAEKKAAAKKAAAKRAAEKRADEAAAERRAEQARERAAAERAAERREPTMKALRKQVVAYAVAQLGQTYPWSSAEDACDCTELTRLALARAGIQIPAGLEAQRELGRPISRDELRPGDLVLAGGGHIGVYAGGGRVIHAPDGGDTVRAGLLPAADKVDAYLTYFPEDIPAGQSADMTDPSDAFDSSSGASDASGAGDGAGGSASDNESASDGESASADDASADDAASDGGSASRDGAASGEGSAASDGAASGKGSAAGDGAASGKGDEAAGSAAPQPMRMARGGGEGMAGTTPVTLAGGQKKPLARIRKGDVVIATDPTSGVTLPRKVTSTSERVSRKPLVEIVIRGGDELTVAGDQRLYDPIARRWVKAADLRKGGSLAVPAGPLSMIEKGDEAITSRVPTPITRVARAAPAGSTVHSLSVSGIHTFYAGGDTADAAPVLAHNVPPDDPAPDDPAPDDPAAGDPAAPEGEWPEGLDRIPPYARDYQSDESSGSVKLLVWKREDKQTTIVQRRADGSVLETTGESRSNGVPFEIKGGIGRLQGGADLTVSWKDDRSEALLFDNEQQYRDYTARVDETRKRIFDEEMAGAPVDAGDESAAAREMQERLDRVDERADAIAEDIRHELTVPKISTDGSSKREEGGLGGDLIVAGGKIGGNHEAGRSVTVNDQGTVDPSDDVRIETDTVSTSGVDREAKLGFSVKGVGPEGKVTYESTGTRSGQLIYEDGKPVRYVQLKEQDWKGGWSATLIGRKAKGTGGDDLATDDGVTTIRTEVDLNRPGAMEALQRWQEAQRAYDAVEFNYRSAGGAQAGDAADPQGFAQAKVALDDATREWGRYLDEGLRTRGEYSRDTPKDVTPGLEGCVVLCVGVEGGESHETRRLLGSYYRDPESGEWRPYTHGMPNDRDGDGVADDDYGNTTNYGPGSGNPTGDTSGGDLDDAPALEPGDPLPDFPERPGPVEWDADGDGIKDTEQTNNYGPGSGNPDQDVTGGDLDDERPGAVDPGGTDADGDGIEDTWQSNNVGPGSGNPGGDASGGDLDDARPWVADPGDPDRDRDGWDDDWPSNNVGPGSGNPDGDSSGGDLDDAPGYEDIPDSTSGTHMFNEDGMPDDGSDGDQSHVWGEPDRDQDGTPDDEPSNNVGPGSGNPSGDASGGDLDDRNP